MPTEEGAVPTEGSQPVPAALCRAMKSCRHRGPGAVPPSGDSCRGGEDQERQSCAYEHADGDLAERVASRTDTSPRDDHEDGKCWQQRPATKHEGENHSDPAGYGCVEGRLVPVREHGHGG